MLLRQKAIVEGGLALLLATARYADLAQHADDAEQRARAQALLDLLTPIAKTFPAERGFEANTLAIQVHGGYGYTAEYLPEAWLRDQKLNSIHEGTTGIQSQDLLGRKVLRDGGAAFERLREEIAASCEAARGAGLGEQADAIERALSRTVQVTGVLLARRSDGPSALRHSADYLDLLASLVVGWQWLVMARAAARGLAGGGPPRDAAFYRGKLRAADYFFRTELPRVQLLAELCEADDDSYDAIEPDAF
jgi:butyryl-CoA dehydrogenase